MRVFLGLTEVSGFFARLEEGFRAIGVQAEHVTLYHHHFGYSRRTVRWQVRWAQAAVATRKGQNERGVGSFLATKIALLNVIVSRAVLFVWALSRFDVFVLGAGSSFFGLHELRLLKLFGKKVFYTLHGTDARPPYVDGFFPPYVTFRALEEGARHSEEAALSAQLRAETLRRKAWLRRLEEHADAVVCGPGYAQMLTRPFVSIYALGLPTPELMCSAPAPGPVPGPVRLLHAPSQLEGKGTRSIRRMVQAMIAEGREVDYVEISGRPNEEVIEQLLQSDLVIDQVYSDTPMAGLAAEAAMCGRPALVGGYFSEHAASQIPAHMLPPTEFCSPDQMQERLRGLIKDQAARDSLGAAAREFVMTSWTPEKVARKFVRLFRDVPEDWWVSPEEIAYVEGCGLSREEAAENIRRIVARFGGGALELAHNPRLEASFLALAETAPRPLEARE